MQRVQIAFMGKVLRQQPELPRYVVVRPEGLEGRTHAFDAKVRLNEAGPFDRHVRPWGRGSAAFFFNLTERQCHEAGLDTGDRCTVRIDPME